MNSNANLQATVESATQDYEKLKALFDKDFGDVVRYEDGVLKWRPEVLQETVLQGKDFSIKLGKPQAGLLDLLKGFSSYYKTKSPLGTASGNSSFIPIKGLRAL